MRTKRLSIFLTILFVILLIPVTVLAQETNSAPQEKNYQPGEAIVCLTRSAARSMADDDLLGASESLLTLSGNAGDIKTAGEGDVTELRLVRSASLSTEELIKQLKAKPGVLYAEPNYIYTIDQTADNADADSDLRNTSQIQTQAGSSDSVYTGDFTFLQYANAGENSIEVPDWNNPANVNADGVVVAVLDTGVNYKHEDLAPVLWDKGLDYPELTAMGGGKYGINTLKENSKGVPYDSTDPMDDHSHGSHCAGIIGAAWNGKGISGAANGVKIMAVKIGLDDGSTPLANIVKGFQYVIAAKQAGVNVKVTSNSYGGRELSLALNDAFKAAGENGIVSAKAAGNESTDLDFASIDSGTFKTAPEMVIVGASNAAGESADFSNVGKRTTHVFAPGNGIFSTVLSEGGKTQYAVSKPAEGTEDTFNPEQQRLYTGVPADATLTVKQGKATVTHSANAEDTTVRVEAGKGWNNSGAMVIGNEKGNNAAVSVTGAPRIKSGELLMSVRATTAGLIYWQDSASKNITTIEVKANAWTDVNVDANDFSDNSVFFFHPTSEGTGYEVAVDGMYLSDDQPDYGYKSGTSMATPAAAGEAAILCKTYPDDSPEKIAARIKGSVNPKEKLADLCASGGIISTQKALNGETVPVLNDCLKAGDNTCALSGYFFGSGGTLTVDGKPIQPSSWSDTTVTFIYDDSLMKGEHIYEVTSSVGSGRQFFTLQNNDNLMDHLPTPDDALFQNSLMTSSCGLDGKIYFVMHQEVPKQSSSLWAYTPGYGGKWELIAAELPFDFIDGKMCAWNHKLLVPCVKLDPPRKSNDNKTEFIAVYDPKTGDTQYIDVSESAHTNPFMLMNTGDRVYAYYCENFLGLVKTPMLGIVDPRNLTIEANRLIDTTHIDITKIPTANMFADDAGRLFLIGGIIGNNNTDHFVRQLDVVNPDADLGNRLSVVSDDVFGDGFPEKQDLKPIVAEPMNGGAIISGYVKTDDAGHVVADTFKLNTGAVNTSVEGGDLKLEPLDKRISDTKVSSISGTVYDNHFYALGFTDNDMTNRVFTDYPIDGSNNAGDRFAPSAAYEVHGQNYGWTQGEKRDGEFAGTTGQSLRLEALRLAIKGDDGQGIDGLGITYRVHMKDISWGEWVSDGAAAGTEGQGRQIEAAEIKLTGDKAAGYDIYYRVHMKELGWGDWVTGGKTAGTTGQDRRIEAIEIRIVPKGGKAPENVGYGTLAAYEIHGQNYGWTQGEKQDGQLAGTTGQGLRLEALRAAVKDDYGQAIKGLGVTYRVHMKNLGWGGWSENGAAAGTERQSRQIEAVEIKLTGDKAAGYDIYYRVHMKELGWGEWVNNGAMAGTTGQDRRIEAIEIKVVPKGGAAPTE